MNIKAIIRQSDAIVYEGEVETVSSTNEKGQFDILPHHAHFVGLIEKFVEVRTNGQLKRWDIDRGILTVNDQQVEIYLGY